MGELGSLTGKIIFVFTDLVKKVTFRPTGRLYRMASSKLTYLDVILYWSFRIGIRCRDADVKILDITPPIMDEPGRTSRIAMTKRQLLESIHQHIVMELANLALED